jgi:hypothetical protein
VVKEKPSAQTIKPPGRRTAGSRHGVPGLNQLCRSRSPAYLSTRPGPNLEDGGLSRMKVWVHPGKVLAAAVSLGLLAAAPARAQDPLHLQLSYDGSLYVKVLEVAVDQVLDNRTFQASAHVKTFGLLALLQKINLRARSEGRFENAAVLPRTFSYVNADGRKNRHVSAVWSPADVSTEAEPRFTNMGEPAATKEQRLEAADPLTVLTRITVLPQADKPCQGVSQFFDGKQRYDLEYSYRGPAQPDEREKRLGVTSAARCGLTYREVAGFKRKPASQRTQGIRHEISLGLGRIGPDGPWVISYIKADTFLGRAEIDLVNAHVSGRRPD